MRADRPKITRALDGKDFRPMLRRPRIIDHLEAGEVQIVPERFLQLNTPITKLIRRKQIILHLPAVDDVKLHRVLVNIAAMKTLDAKFNGAGVPRPGVRPESN